MINEDLSSQLKSLKQQFDHVIKINSNLEETFAKHNSTVKELISVRAERDDFEERLKMSLQTNDDLVYKLQSLNNINNESKTNEMIRNFTDVKKRLREKEVLISEIVQAASSYFSTFFESIDDVVNLLRGNENPNESFHQAASSFGGAASRKSAATNNTVQRMLDPQVTELRKQISTLKKHNDEFNDQLAEMSMTSQDKPTKTVGQLSDDPFDIPGSPRSLIPNSPRSHKSRTINFNDDLDDPNSQISSLREEREKMLTLIDRQNDLTTNLESKLRKANIELEDLKEKNRNMSREVRKSSSYSDNYDSGVPESVFMSPEFPSDLEKMVSGISKNPSLHLSTKIRQIISVIHNYYRSRNEHIEKDLKEAKAKNSKVDSLIALLHTLFPSTTINYNALLEDEIAKNAFKETVNRLKAKLEEYKNEKEKLEMQTEKILINIDSKSIHDAIGEISNLKSEQNEYKKLQMHVAIQEEAFERKISELKAERSNLEKENSNLKSQLANQKEKAKNIQNECDKEILENKEKCQREINRIKDSNIEEINKIKSFTEEKMKNFEDLQRQKMKQFEEQNLNKIEILKAKHLKDLDAKDLEYEGKTNQINELKQELEVLKGANALQTSELEQCKTIIKKLKGRKDKRDKELELLKKQYTDDEKEYKERMKAQKDSTQTRIDQLTQLRAKEAKEHSHLICELKAQLDNVTRENTELSKKNTNMSVIIQKLETKINAFSADRERERRDFDSKLKAQSAAAHTELEGKINEIKVKSDEARHKLYQNIIKQLQPLAGTGDKFDESNFDSFLCCIRRRIENILSRETRIRSLMSLNQYESIEDAIIKTIKGSKKIKMRREF
ncbi:hypothetical protein TRFO_27466 [Tritrichomonas foetus]|uniref:Uncharacterized protein n=1 Tax=Tritrichomonas foetus TaxID=1144522 RepID=A0A1J4K5K7_9EUKA|nr:hypothetical protein TRFO_27466 [Tritrichomonas foetus]|eukprot:OHT04958.1 hypothetical protein TRFO_27466 [Tritrichomonas foetus]